MINTFIPKEIAKKLRHYVYLYMHPDTNEIFYVGQGKGNRVFAHLNDSSISDKVALIKELREEGKAPRIDILIHGLQDESIAKRIEAAVIDLIGKDKLSNQSRGWRSGQYGRMDSAELIAMYAQKPVKISEPSVLIRINKLYHFGMSPMELYDVTRGRWRISSKREKAQFAFSVYDGIVKEVYEIKHWLPAGSTFSTRKDEPPSDRWEFVGNLADTAIRRKYINKSVAGYFKKGSRFPIRFLNIKQS
ncbi:hypothetical protein ACFLRP_03610 [Bacteroidota bacterium]